MKKININKIQCPSLATINSELCVEVVGNSFMQCRIAIGMATSSVVRFGFVLLA